MKKICFKFVGLILSVVMVITFVGCSEKTSNKNVGTNGVDSIIQEQMGKENGQSQSDSGAETKAGNSVVKENSDSSIEYNNIDYDLTGMNKDMVYATVYQMVNDYNSYVGKVFKIKGTFNVMYDENTGKNYFFCIVSDALACCQSGLEFVWEDGTHVYPDEYPKQGTNIEVVGAVEMYKDPGDTTSYMRLGNCKMTIVGE